METAQLAQYINIVFDDPVLQIVGLTVEEDVAFGPANLHMPLLEIHESVSEALEATRLKGFEKRNPRTMSGGEQQLLAVAGILAMRPKVIVLDEPVAMLDPRGKTQVLNVIRQLRDKFGATIVIAESGTDIESICEFSDQLVLLQHGRILAQEPASSLFAKHELLEDTKFKIPQVTRLAWKLEKGQLAKVPTTLPQGIKYIEQKLKHGMTVSKTIEQAEISYQTNNHDREPAIVVKNLHHVFHGDPPVLALKGINMIIYKGEMVALLGQNGSGKTTLSYHLVGIEKPTNPDATILVDGLDVIHSPIKQVVRRINYLFQNPSNQIFCETFGEEVSFGPKQLGMNPQEIKDKALASLSMVGLEHLWNYYTMGRTRSEETLLSLASVLAMDPQILICDEPTGGLDHDAAERVMSTLTRLNQEGRTILIITHDMELAATYTHRIIVLRQGEVLLDGTPKDVFAQTQILESTQLFPPQIMRLAQCLSRYNVPQDILTVEEFFALCDQKATVKGN
jgi:energy-coupling factor transport system ATP-binding protein